MIQATADSSSLRSSAATSALERSFPVEPEHTRGPPSATLAGLALAGLVLSAAAVVVALTGAGPEPRTLAAAAHALVIAAPIGAGIYALRTQAPPADRFGWVLVAAGLLWSPTLLAEAADSLPYSIGRVSVWFAEALLVYVVLAYPSGRLTEPVDRFLFGAALLVVAVLFLPMALLAEGYPVPNPWSSCGTDCPPNALMAVSSEPGFVDMFLTPLALAASVSVYVGVALRLIGRLAQGSHLRASAWRPWSLSPTCAARRSDHGRQDAHEVAALRQAPDQAQGHADVHGNAGGSASGVRNMSTKPGSEETAMSAFGGQWCGSSPRIGNRIALGQQGHGQEQDRHDEQAAPTGTCPPARSGGPRVREHDVHEQRLREPHGHAADAVRQAVGGLREQGRRPEQPRGHQHPAEPIGGWRGCERVEARPDRSGDHQRVRGGGERAAPAGSGEGDDHRGGGQDQTCERQPGARARRSPGVLRLDREGPLQRGRRRARPK